MDTHQHSAQSNALTSIELVCRQDCDRTESGAMQGVVWCQRGDTTSPPLWHVYGPYSGMRGAASCNVQRHKSHLIVLVSTKLLVMRPEVVRSQYWQLACRTCRRYALAWQN